MWLLMKFFYPKNPVKLNFLEGMTMFYIIVTTAGAYQLTKLLFTLVDRIERGRPKRTRSQ